MSNESEAAMVAQSSGSDVRGNSMVTSPTDQEQYSDLIALPDPATFDPAKSRGTTATMHQVRKENSKK